MRIRQHDEVRLPFPTVPVSNGEWVPLPITKRQEVATQLIAEECDTLARRHGMTRAQFLRTAAATAAGFSVMNRLWGVDQTGDAAALPITPDEAVDLAAAAAKLDASDYFIMDVQQHHLDVEEFGETQFLCFLEFVDSDLPCPESIGQINYIREIFVNSETDVGVISGLPNGIPLGPEGMATTRKLINRLARSKRAYNQAICDPKNPPESATSIASLEHQVKDLKGAALKCYTYSGNWRLDDEAIAYPMLEEASRLGLGLVNVHKGLPAIFAPGSEETVRATDFPKVVRDWPNLRFCAYHSAYFQGTEHPEGKLGNSEFIELVEAMPTDERARVYAEVGSTFAIIFLSEGPAGAARYIGQLLKTFGDRNILWGTDSVWWGSPQFLIDAFKALEIPADMQEKFGFPALTEASKRRILGENAAELYGVKIKKRRRKINPDKLDRLAAQQGGLRAGRSLRWYGPQTRREFFAMLRGEWRPRV